MDKSSSIISMVKGKPQSCTSIWLGTPRVQSTNPGHWGQNTLYPYDEILLRSVDTYALHT